MAALRLAAKTPLAQGSRIVSTQVSPGIELAGAAYGASRGGAMGALVFWIWGGMTGGMAGYEAGDRAADEYIYED